jgi:hypothetical protein
VAALLPESLPLESVGDEVELVEVDVEVEVEEVEVEVLVWWSEA